MNNLITSREATEKTREFNKDFYQGIFKTFKEKYYKYPIAVPRYNFKKAA